MIDFRAELEKRGVAVTEADDNNVLIFCPFHNDAGNPNCAVSLTTGGWHCWSCHDKGSFYKLVGKLDGVSPQVARQRFWEDMDSCRDLEKICSDVTQLGKPESAKRVYIDSASFHKKYRTLPEQAQTYLLHRNCHPQMWKRFGLLFAAEGKYRNRVIIPIRDLKGRIVSYTGRTIIDGVKPKTKKARSPHSVLFGLYELCKRHGISTFPYLVVVEGEFDCMFLQQYGIFAVSVMGTHGMSLEQKSLIVQHTDHLFLCYDPDNAGRKALQRDLDYFSSLLSVSKIVLPGEKDPDELTKQELNKYFKGVRYV